MRQGYQNFKGVTLEIIIYHWLPLATTHLVGPNGNLICQVYFEVYFAALSSTIVYPWLSFKSMLDLLAFIYKHVCMFTQYSIFHFLTLATVIKFNVFFFAKMVAKQCFIQMNM